MTDAPSSNRPFFLALAILIFSTGIGALNVTLITPFSWQNHTDWTLNFTLDANASSCALYTNESGFGPVANTSFLNLSNAFYHNFTQGTWTWAVACTDQNQSTTFSTNSTVGVDTSIPGAPPLTVSGFNVSWYGSASDAASGFARFELYRNNTLVFNTTNKDTRSFVDTSAPSGALVYSLKSVSMAGNTNTSTATSDALSGILNLTVLAIPPRSMNLTWSTNVPANGSALFTTANGASFSNSSATLDTQHNLLITSPAFGPLTGTLTSCSRKCVNVTVSQNLTSTIAISMVFYNAFYNNQNATLSVHWDSAYPLSSVQIASNNSGMLSTEFATAVAGNTSSFSQNVSFQINATASEVDWTANAADNASDFYQTDPFILHVFANAATQATPVPPVNTTYTLLHIGEQFNASNGYRLRLLDISRGSVGPQNLLTAVFETLNPDGSADQRFSMEEQGKFNTSTLAIAMYNVFVGTANASYAQVDAEPIGPATPTPTPIPTATATSTPSPMPTPTPAPVQPEVHLKETTSSWSGSIQNIQVSQPPRSGSPLSGYVISDDGNTAVSFNSSYKNTGNDTALLLVVRVQDATNHTAGVAKSTPLNVSSGKTVWLSTEEMQLPAGDYRAEAMVVTQEQNRVIDSKSMVFRVQQPGADDALKMVTLVGVLSLAVFLFIVKINHHKKSMLP